MHIVSKFKLVSNKPHRKTFNKAMCDSGIRRNCEDILTQKSRSGRLHQNMRLQLLSLNYHKCAPASTASLVWNWFGIIRHLRTGIQDDLAIVHRLCGGREVG